MNWSISSQRYPYLIKVLTIGDASLPQGQPFSLLWVLGVPTRSMITELVSQYDATGNVSIKESNRQCWKRTERKPGHDKLAEIVKHLNMQEKQSNDIMTAAVNTPEMYHCV